MISLSILQLSLSVCNYSVEATVLGGLLEVTKTREELSAFQGAFLTHKYS